MRGMHPTTMAFLKQNAGRNPTIVHCTAHSLHYHQDFLIIFAFHTLIQPVPFCFCCPAWRSFLTLACVLARNWACCYDRIEIMCANRGLGKVQLLFRAPSSEQVSKRHHYQHWYVHTTGLRSPRKQTAHQLPWHSVYGYQFGPIAGKYTFSLSCGSLSPRGAGQAIMCMTGVLNCRFVLNPHCRHCSACL
jgi:hypothetical protein